MIPRALTLAAGARALGEGRLTSRALVELALEAVAAAPAAFVRIDSDAARAAAEASDGRRRAGRALSDFDGLPVSLKDLFDVKGEPTPAGSALRRDAAPAGEDAEVVSRLRAAGLVLLGRTQMSEFAFTGVGLNPHSATLANPFDPARAAGGSSGGAAASVALGQALGAIGTDTGGSIRIPAAFCGVVGFKPTQRRVSRRGATPLSTSLDSVGPIARTVADCRLLDSLIAEAALPEASMSDLRGRSIGVPSNLVMDEADPIVQAAFEPGLRRLAAAGAEIRSFRFEALEAALALQAKGGISNAEAYAYHRRSGSFTRKDAIDPNVLVRLMIGERLSAADYIDLLAGRSLLIASAQAETRAFDAVAMPTTPVLAPRLAELQDPAAFQRTNGLILRNPAFANFLDRCAVSLPMATKGAVPSGFMLMGEPLGDGRLLDLAEAAAPLLAASA